MFSFETMLGALIIAEFILGWTNWKIRVEDPGGREHNKCMRKLDKKLGPKMVIIVFALLFTLLGFYHYYTKSYGLFFVAGFRSGNALADYLRYIDLWK